MLPCGLARIPSWYEHVDPALTALRAGEHAAVARPDIEHLLHLSRRDAIRFLHRCGAEEQGDRLEAPTEKVISELLRVKKSAQYVSEMMRRERMAEERLELQRQSEARKILLGVPVSRPRPAAMLPKSVKLSPAKLVIEFAPGDGRHLLAQLLEVARYARDDPEGFRMALEESNAAV